MRRFYCLTCKSLKRVRLMPANVENPDHPEPYQRVGDCRWHTTSFQGSHRAFLGHAPDAPVMITRRPIAAPLPPKGKKARRAKPFRQQEDVA